VLAENFAQPGMKQMRSRVIPHGRLTHVGIHNGVDFVSDAQRLLSNNLIAPHTLNRRIDPVTSATTVL